MLQPTGHLVGIVASKTTSVFHLVPAKELSLDKSGTQNDNSDDPVRNIREPGTHFIIGGSVSVLPQHAT